ncbi:MAG: pyridoxal phosphate-dependent aminotransferase [Lachnospiraceae bacterium]|nr:pyridoxal phosphate-dependent aminotransferase [Lachnospiraceae bacterium]
MINEFYKKMLDGKSVIRTLSEKAVKRGQEIGYENVFDFSLGNPSVPVPQKFTDILGKLIANPDSMYIHGYSQSQGIPEVRAALAKQLNERFGMDYTAEHLFMTSGAAGAIAHALRAVTVKGDTVITFAPFFPEYHPYVDNAGRHLKVVPPDTERFQINTDEFEKALTEDVKAVLINSPNNPSGTVYSTETIKTLTDMMREAEKKYGHEIFLISDEPYREIIFEGTDSPYITKYYDNSLSCYSYSKSLSIPGERIGYIAVNPNCKDADILSVMCGQISRGLGHNCPAALFQRAVAEAGVLTSDLSVYETNMNLLYNELTALGFNIVKPGGTFYMFPQSPEPDAVEFCMKAFDRHDLVLVPADSFGCPGYFRIAYCVETEKVERSLDAFRKLMKG